MKTAIVYYSKHHGNTKRLVDAIARLGDITLIDASSGGRTDLSAYDLIGFASGTYGFQLHTSVLEFAEEHLPRGKRVFVVYTYGAKRPKTDALVRIFRAKAAQLLGTFGCPGFCTFGPFRLIGGIAKGRPSKQDITEAVTFFNELIARCAEKT